MRFMPFVAFLFLLVGIALAVVSLWADSRSGRHRAMVVAGLLLAWWAFCMIPVYGAESGATALFWYQASLPGILFLIPAVYWIYLDQAHVPSLWKTVVVVAVAAFGAVLYGLYFLDGFYFDGFRQGPWGNIGIVSPQPFWYLVASTFYLVTHTAVVALLLVCRARARSDRLRRLYTANALGLIATACVFGVAFTLETYAGWPPMDMVAAGFYLVGVNAYLMGRYRYLLREPAVDVRQIGGTLSEPFLVLDASMRVVSANARAAETLGTSVGEAFPRLFDNSEALERGLNDLLARREPGTTLRAVRSSSPFEVNVAPSFDKFGDCSGAVAVVRPMSSHDAEGLTARELEILDLVLRGHDNKTIANGLFISLGTIKNHLYRLYKKVGVESRLELMNKFRTRLTD